MGAHEDLAASRTGDPGGKGETGQVLGHVHCLGDGASVAFDQLQGARCAFDTALKDPGCEGLPLAPDLCEYGDPGPDRLTDRHLVAEDAGDEQAKPRLLLSDVPAVFDFPGFGLRQQGGEPVPDDGVVGHLADADTLTPQADEYDLDRSKAKKVFFPRVVVAIALVPMQIGRAVAVADQMNLRPVPTPGGRIRSRQWPPLTAPTLTGSIAHRDRSNSPWPPGSSRMTRYNRAHPRSRPQWANRR